MSIGAHLLSPPNLELVRRTSWKLGRPQILEEGMRYYQAHPEDVERVAENLAFMGLPSSGPQLDAVLREICAHYYEKLFALVKTYEAYWIAKNRVEVGTALEPFTEARARGQAVFVAQSHFGATYLMAGVFAVHGVELTMVGRFPEPVGSMLRQGIATAAQRYGAARTALLDVDDAQVDVPMEMVRLLMTGRAVANVFDESNAFCRPVQLLGRTIMGGTGMDRVLSSFSDDQVVVVSPFLIRTSSETFRLEVDRHRLDGGDVVASLYRSLEQRVREHHPQWYFIHELHRSFIDGA